jgi:hypothetical protein
LKIDVEGSEHLVLKGAINVLKNFRPILLIEIHSIYCMLKVFEFLNLLNYKVDLLKEEIDGRCFIAAVSFGEGHSSQQEEEKYYLQRYEQINISNHSLQQENNMLRRDYSQIQREYQDLQKVHQNLQQGHQDLQQTRAVAFAKKLEEYPYLLKVATVAYGFLFRIYRGFRGK